MSSRRKSPSKRRRAAPAPRRGKAAAPSVARRSSHPTAYPAVAAHQVGLPPEPLAPEVPPRGR
jgi:hypothetical protein